MSLASMLMAVSCATPPQTPIVSGSEPLVRAHSGPSLATLREEEPPAALSRSTLQANPIAGPRGLLWARRPEFYGSHLRISFAEPPRLETVWLLRALASELVPLGSMSREVECATGQLCVLDRAGDGAAFLPLFETSSEVITAALGRRLAQTRDQLNDALEVDGTLRAALHLALSLAGASNVALGGSYLNSTPLPILRDSVVSLLASSGGCITARSFTARASAPSAAPETGDMNPDAAPSSGGRANEANRPASAELAPRSLPRVLFLPNPDAPVGLVAVAVDPYFSSNGWLTEFSHAVRNDPALGRPRLLSLDTTAGFAFEIAPDKLDETLARLVDTAAKLVDAATGLESAAAPAGRLGPDLGACARYLTTHGQAPTRASGPRLHFFYEGPASSPAGTWQRVAVTRTRGALLYP